MRVFLCERKRGRKRKNEKRKKGGDRPHFPLKGPHLPCHVVSTPSTERVWPGRGLTPFALLYLVLLLCLGFVLWMPASSSRGAL